MKIVGAGGAAGDREREDTWVGVTVMVAEYLCSRDGWLGPCTRPRIVQGEACYAKRAGAWRGRGIGSPGISGDCPGIREGRKEALVRSCYV